jgi:hypothetical protein
MHVHNCDALSGLGQMMDSLDAGEKSTEIWAQPSIVHARLTQDNIYSHYVSYIVTQPCTQELCSCSCDRSCTYNPDCKNG